MYFYLCISICVFVFVYLYLCICIFVFVFAYLYMCICTQRQQLIGGVGWYEWCSCTTPLGGLSLSHNLNANTIIDVGHSPIQCNQNLMNLWVFFTKVCIFYDCGFRRYGKHWCWSMWITNSKFILSSFSRNFLLKFFNFLWSLSHLLEKTPWLLSYLILHFSLLTGNLFWVLRKEVQINIVEKKEAYKIQTHSK